MEPKLCGEVKLGEKESPIFVTQPDLPPLSEFVPYLEKIWSNRILTNGGPLHVELENELCKYLGVEFISLFNNATIALLVALQALRVKGEVITVPFSFVATANSIVWNGLKPVFVDICPRTLNIDVSKIEKAITADTSAIMPVHCYGNPCNYESVRELADRYGLKVIYDAAHAFGVQVGGESVLRFGDLSVLSFHATKVFNTFEGGAIVSPDLKTKRRIDYLKNFGIVDEVTCIAPGINGKMSEFNAALGLIQLKYVDMAIAKRRKVANKYRELLKNVKGIRADLIREDGVTSNYSYFPILIGPEFRMSRDAVFRLLRDNNIYARRYFYPLISEFPMYRGFGSAQRDNLPVAHEVSEQILCLPIYPDLAESAVESIVQLIAGL